MRLCRACDCHVLAFESSCPHCGAPLTTSAPLARVGATALSAGLTMLACTTDTGPGETAATTTTTTMTMSGSATATGMDSETTDAETTDSTDSTETTDTSTTDSDSLTDTDDSLTDTDTMGEGSEAAYGVPSLPCEEFDPTPVSVGANPITIDTTFSELGQNCGGVGTASVFVFTAEAAGDYAISLDDADFEGVISFYGDFCGFFDEFGCALPPDTLMTGLDEGQTIHIAVDANDMPTDGSATLTLTLL